MKIFILYTKNSIDTSIYSDIFKKFCKNSHIDYTVSSFNDSIYSLMSKIMNISVPKLKSFVVDEKNVSYREGRIYKQFTNFKNIFDVLKASLPDDVLMNSFDANITAEYNLITDLDNINQLNYIKSARNTDDIITININDFRFRVKNSKLITNKQDFEKLLEPSIIFDVKNRQ